MSKRKPFNAHAVAERKYRALLSRRHVAVVNIDPSGKQIMADWRTGKQVTDLDLAHSLFDFAHHWVIYMSGMCIDQRGAEYLKSVEIAPEGVRKVERLDDVIEHFYLDLRASCNQQHLVASGWIAIPANVSLTEEQATRLFAATGAWNQVKVA